jgi:hypothetical protein
MSEPILLPPRRVVVVLDVLVEVLDDVRVLVVLPPAYVVLVPLAALTNERIDPRSTVLFCEMTAR